MKIETHLDHQTILANQARPVFFAVRLCADSLAAPRPRPAAFCLVLDSSGSMEGPPLQHAKQAAALAVKHLRAGDYFGLVTFESDAQVVVPLQIVKDKPAVQSAIAKIGPAGGTNLSGGWLLGRDELRKAPAGAARRLLLLSDGHLNAGIVEPPAVRQLVAAGLEHDTIRTGCLGFGDGYNEDLMAELARSTNGAFYDADSPEKLPAIFTAELDGLQRLAAQNVRLRLKRLDFCESLVALGEYPVVELPDGRHEFALGDFVSNEDRVVCFALEVLPLPCINNQPVTTLEGEDLLALEVVYDELTADSVVSRTFTQKIRIQATQDPGAVKQNGEVIGWVAVQRAGKVLQEVTRRMDAGDAAAAHALLRETAAEFRSYPPSAAVEDALRSIDDVERQIAEQGWNSRSRKQARYLSASYGKMSSQEQWTSLTQAPSFKKPPGQPQSGLPAEGAGSDELEEDLDEDEISDSASPLEVARRLFEDAGLGFPNIPMRLVSEWRQHDEWLFSTRSELDENPYAVDFFIDEAEQKEVDDYVLLSHSGHGFNSYAIQYYAVLGPLRLFLFLGFGGAFMDQEAAAGLIRRCFMKADEIMAAVEGGAKLPKAGLTIFASDFYGSYWKKGKGRCLDSALTPDALLDEVLAWLTSKANGRARRPSNRSKL